MRPNKKLIIIITAVGLSIIAILTIILISIIASAPATYTLTLAYAPSDSTPIIDDTSYPAGTTEVRLTPGTYLVTVSRDDFDSESQVIDLTADTSAYFTLVPTEGGSAEDYYTEHPAENQLYYEIYEKKQAQRLANAVETYPAIADFPYEGDGFTLTADNCLGVFEEDLDVCVMITASDLASRRSAIDYLSNIITLGEYRVRYDGDEVSPWASDLTAPVPDSSASLEEQLVSALTRGASVYDPAIEATTSITTNNRTYYAVLFSTSSGYEYRAFIFIDDGDYYMAGEPAPTLKYTDFANLPRSVVDLANNLRS